MKTIYIFRHGETNYNKLNIRAGLSEAELTEHGKEQAKVLGNLLKDKNIKHIYSSYLKRAKETANIVKSQFNYNNIPIEIIDGLQEINMGIEEGKNKANIGEEARKILKEKDCDYKFIDGESKFECRERFFNTLLKLCKISKYDIFAVSSHFYTIKQLLIKLDYENFDNIKNCEYVKLEFDNNIIKVIERLYYQNF